MTVRLSAGRAMPGSNYWILVSASVVGAVSLTISTIVSSLVANGATPAMLYGSAGDAASSLLRWRGLPVEWFGIPWFVSVLGLVGLRPNRWEAQADWLFLTAVPVLGYSLWLAIPQGKSGVVVPVVVAAGAAAVIMTLAARLSSTVQRVPRALVNGALTVTRDVKLRAALLGGLALSLGLGTAVQDNGQGTTAQENFRAFRNWYLSVTPTRPLSDRPLKVTAFTDYLCVECLSQVLLQQGLVDEALDRGKQRIEFTVKNLPAGADCPAVDANLSARVSDAGCAMAVAVRLIQQERGVSGAMRLVLVLARLGRNLTDLDVERQIAELGLLQRYQQQFSRLLRDVNADIAEGRRLGVTAPAIMVNDLILPRSAPGFLEWALQLEGER